MSVDTGQKIDAVYRCIAANTQLGGIGMREIAEDTGLTYNEVRSAIDSIRRRGDALRTRR